MANAEKQLLTLDELRGILGLSRTTIYQLARKDELPVPVIRIGRRMLCSKPALDRVLNRQHGEAA